MSDLNDCDQKIYIGEIGNSQGGLVIASQEGKKYWCIEDPTGFFWQEIPLSLFNELETFTKQPHQ